MSVIIKLLNLPLQANSIDVRTFFRGLGIPDGGVHIVGLDAGIAFIAFSGDEDARQAMEMSGGTIQGSAVRLFLSSRNEMFKVIEQARQDSLEQARRTSGLSTGISPSNAGNVSATLRDTNSASAFPSHQPHIPQMSNNSLMGNQSDIVGSTSAFGIPQMSAFSGMMNMSSNNLPHGISAQSPFAPPINSTSQMPPQMNSLMGQPQTGSNTNIFNTSMNSGQPPSRSQSQAHSFGMMPFGSNIPPLINTNSQPPLAFSSNLSQSGSVGIGGQHQNNGLLGHGQQMHIPTPLVNSMGLPNPNLGSGVQNPGHFSSGGDRLEMAGGVGSNVHSSSPFANQTGFGNHGSATNLPISTSGSSPFGIEVGNTRAGGRGRVSRFNNVSDDDMGFGRNSSGSSSFGRGRQTRDLDLGSIASGKEKHGLGGGFGRGEGGHSGRDRDQSSISRDRSERSTKRSRSRSRDRRDSRRPPGGRGDRGREDSRDRERRRRTKSKSRSRSRERDRSTRGGRRNSSLETQKINSSPEKNRNDDDKNSSGNDDVLIINEGSDEDFPCVKLTGVPKESSSRDIKDFIRVEIRGGTDGIVRNHEEGLAFIRLQNASDYPKAYRQSGHKIDGSVCRVEGIRLEVWDNAHNTIKLPGFDRDKVRGRDSNRGRERGDRDSRVRDYDRSGVREPGSIITSTTECCLLIQGLPPAFSAKDIALRILTGVRSWVYSEIVIQQVPSEIGRPTVNAYVQIMSLQEAQKIIDAISRTDEGSSLRMQVVDIGQLWQAKKLNESAPGGFKDRETSRFSSLGETKSLFDTDLGLEIGSGSSSVILRGVPNNMSERDVVDFFSDIGSTPMNVQMLMDPTGARNGQVVCEFQDARRARLAATKDGMTIGRNTISVQLFNRRGNVEAPVALPLLSPPDFNGFPNARGPPRAGVLGMRPSRFPNPMFRSPNPFVQAMQQEQSSRGSRAPGGPRMRGSRFMGRGGPRMGVVRNAFESTNGVLVGDDALGITSTRRIESMFEKPGCVVAVTNIPYSATMDDILRFLAGLLDSEINRDRIIRRYNEFQQATGDARIAFDSPTEAKRALDLLTGSTMWNRKLEVSLPSEF